MATPTAIPAALGVGSNLGDSAQLIRQAAALLAEGGLREIRLSSLHRTEPVDCVPGCPQFVNAAAAGLWGRGAAELLELCQTVEQALGRPARHSSRDPRPMDLDILLFGRLAIRTPRLIVPHPRMAVRLFALAPLAEVAGDWSVPPGGRTVAENLRALLRSGA